MNLTYNNITPSLKKHHPRCNYLIDVFCNCNCDYLNSVDPHFKSAKTWYESYFKDAIQWDIKGLVAGVDYKQSDIEKLPNKSLSFLRDYRSNLIDLVIKRRKLRYSQIS